MSERKDGTDNNFSGNTVTAEMTEGKDKNSATDVWPNSRIDASNRKNRISKCITCL